ncbi:MAG: hypothetical protein A2287_10940 [Candidatus Melainabacteria bacterium RIFOXYA12_FULL_32_12]|nr:MAG: hypothetical protein A2255_10120 [Candidatus Melainabacteria bacterium RIFOXYA2_FULL_32_9]OGI31879.1 MAG: hypothetical protein A2287_10940 [Candidatus Melainabacteria bacterium RIFOXYA12_FULL_32_12]
MPFPTQNDLSKNFINNNNLKTKQKQRKKLKSGQTKKYGFTLLVILFLGFALHQTFLNTYDYLFLRKIKNASIQIPNDPSFYNSAEKYFANNYFLGTKTLGDVSFEKPLMKRMTLAKNMPRLTNRLKYLAKQYPSLEPGIFIWDFSTGQYVDINADQEFPTASIVKIPILLQLFRRAELGFANLNDRMSLAEYNITGGSGYLQYKPVGTVFPIHHLARLMIQESDNTATNMILSTVGGINELNRVLRSWGFSKTHMSDLLPDLYGTNVSTPKDMGTMLFNLDNSDFLTLKSRAAIVDIMSHVRNRFLIQAGLPDNAQFIHKSGDIGTMLGDAGIVMLPDGRKYIIVIMVKRPWNLYSAKEFIINASKITYNSYARWDY